MPAVTEVLTHTAGPTARAQEGKLFFVDIEFQESGEVFHRLGVQSLPFLFRLPTGALKREGKISISEADKMTAENFPSYPWSAEDIGSFTAERTGLPAPEVRAIPRRPFGALAVVEAALPLYMPLLNDN